MDLTAFVMRDKQRGRAVIIPFSLSSSWLIKHELVGLIIGLCSIFLLALNGNASVVTIQM